MCSPDAPAGHLELNYISDAEGFLSAALPASAITTATGHDISVTDHRRDLAGDSPRGRVRALSPRATPTGSRSRAVRSADRTLVRPNTVGVQWDKLRLRRYNSLHRPARQEHRPLYPEYPPSRRGNGLMAGNRQPITQPSVAPTTKVAAGGAAGALTVLVVWILGLLHVPVTPEVASAITVIISFITSYLVRQRIPAAATNPSTK
jgi:hypothetical protein